MDQDEPANTEVPTPPQASGHEGHCFVVMPTGRDPEEQRWFKGWYEVVIRHAILDAGFEPVLAAAEEQPGAINDEIRTHLALDGMVVVDIGGAEPDDDPNPNVMYELGIRHALSLPMVMIAWKGQHLPFDVNNQRIIMENRDLLDLDLNKKKLKSFIDAAVQGKFYRPMEAVKRMATIQAATASLGQESLLGALAQEVRELRLSVEAGVDRQKQKRVHREKPTTVKTVIRRFRKELFAHFAEAGGADNQWAAVLRIPLTPSESDEMTGWGLEQWKTYISDRARLATETRTAEPSEPPSRLSDEIIEIIRKTLPDQPFPKGAHRDVAQKLGLSANLVSKCITILIERGELFEQVDGEIIKPEEND